MIDLTGKLLIELRDDLEVDAIVDGRVRGFEPAPGDIQPKGSYKAFVVIVALDTVRMMRSPVQRATFAIRCYGATPQGAMALYGACSDAIHNIGPRLHSDTGIYISADTTGGTAEKDPDSQQPYVTFIAELIAPTQVVA